MVTLENHAHFIKAKPNATSDTLPDQSIEIWTIALPVTS